MLLNKIVLLDLLEGLPNVKFYSNYVCDTCIHGKYSFKNKNIISTSPLELLHMNLFGPINIASLRDKFNDFVTIDDYSRFS